MKWLIVGSGLVASGSLFMACTQTGGSSSSTGSGGGATGTTTASTSSSATGTGQTSSSSSSSAAQGGSGGSGAATTPGTVNCGGPVCDLATQKCCIDSQKNGTCVPNDGGNTCASDTLISMRCEQMVETERLMNCCAQL